MEKSLHAHQRQQNIKTNERKTDKRTPYRNLQATSFEIKYHIIDKIKLKI